MSDSTVMFDDMGEVIKIKPVHYVETCSYCGARPEFEEGENGMIYLRCIGVDCYAACNGRGVGQSWLLNMWNHYHGKRKESV